MRPTSAQTVDFYATAGTGMLCSVLLTRMPQNTYFAKFTVLLSDESSWTNPTYFGCVHWLRGRS